MQMDLSAYGTGSQAAKRYIEGRGSHCVSNAAVAFGEA
jgi:hypothetical protein